MESEGHEEKYWAVIDVSHVIQKAADQQA